MVKKQKYSTQPISWALFISRLIRFFQTGFHDIKVFEKDSDDEYDRLLFDEKDKDDDDFSDNESSRRSVDSQKSIHRHSRKCNHHHQQNKTTEEIVATKTAIITADERV